MWRSQLGSKEVKTITQADDDDWETDPDFVVRLCVRSSVYSTGMSIVPVSPFMHACLPVSVLHPSPVCMNLSILKRNAFVTD